jgi:hypothetical protein
MIDTDACEMLTEALTIRPDDIDSKVKLAMCQSLITHTIPQDAAIVIKALDEIITEFPDHVRCYT